MSSFTDLPGITDPEDPAFRGDLVAILKGSTFGTNALSDAQLSAAVQASSFYGRLGSGSNPYAAAYEVAVKAGLPATFDPNVNQWWNNLAVGRSPEGVARAQDTGGGIGGLIKAALPIAAAFAFAQPELAAADVGTSSALTIGSEFGVQGDLAGTLAGSSLGSEFGVQGDLAGVLAANQAPSFSNVLTGFQTAGQVAGAASSLSKLVSPASATPIQQRTPVSINAAPPANPATLLVLPGRSSGMSATTAAPGGVLSDAAAALSSPSSTTMIVTGVGVALVLAWLFSRSSKG